jgi:hypothetical protein
MLRSRAKKRAKAMTLTTPGGSTTARAIDEMAAAMAFAMLPPAEQSQLRNQARTVVNVLVETRRGPR